jgi:hypothetical protein
VPGQLRLGEAGVVLTPVVVGQPGDPLGRHRAGQQAGRHRGVDDGADPGLLAVRQEFGLRAAVDQ